MSVEAGVAALWGKTNMDPTADVRWHPLLWHLLDTAAVAERLWDVYVSPSYRERLQQSLGLTTPEQTRAWFAVLAAAHDYGKASRDFQQQHKHLAAAVTAAGYNCNHPKTVQHEAVGAAYVWDILETSGVNDHTAYLWGVTTNVLHGRFLQKEEIPAFRSDWGNLCRHIHTIVTATVGATEPLNAANPTGPVIAETAGLIKVSDWVASDPDWFPYEPYHTDYTTYLTGARERAAAAVTAANLHAWTPAGPHLGWTELFPHPEPRESQTQAHTLIADAPLESLLIVEDEMGRGKTETALWCAYELVRKGATGIYFALPTTATAASLHTRMTTWMLSPHLTGFTPTLNTGDWLTRKVVAQRAAAADSDSDEITEDGQTYRITESADWFRGPHRALLSRLGVGTVDQILLSAQNVKYGQARISGLAGRVIVFDEVHAYDPFMQGLFLRALQWLAALGSPVIVLSATLPSKLRAAIANAYRSGLRSADVNEPVNGSHYPAVTLVTADTATLHPVAPPPEKTQVAVELTAAPKDAIPAHLAGTLRAAITSSTGRAAIICNTVRHAQETYDELHTRFPEATITLLHSAFTKADRTRIEDNLLAVYGKNPTTPRTEGLHIIVGTQVLEQSLDVDFDLIITEIAPIDLVLQRLGRVHRHHNPRPTWATTPRIIVAHEPTIDGCPQFRDISYVYDVNAPATMHRTYHALTELTHIERPTDLHRLVETVYDGTPGNLTGAPLQAWQDAAHRQHKAEQPQTTTATELAMKEPWEKNSALPATLASDSDDPKSRHRSRYDTDTTTIAIYDPADKKPLATDTIEWQLRTLQIRKTTLHRHEKAGTITIETPATWARGPFRQRLIVNNGTAATYSPTYGLRIKN